MKALFYSVNSGWDDNFAFHSRYRIQAHNLQRYTPQNQKKKLQQKQYRIVILSYSATL